MRVVIMEQPFGKKNRELKSKLAASIHDRGHTVTWSDDPAALDQATDMVVTWGWFKDRNGGSHIKTYRPDLPVLVMEMGYAGDRAEWTSLGFDGLNGEGNSVSFARLLDDTRVKKYPSIFKVSQQPHHGRRVALICGQVEDDANLDDCSDIRSYYDRVRDEMHDEGYIVTFKDHPEQLRRHNRSLCPSCDVTRVTNPDIREAVAEASVVVAYSSNSLVDAVLAGKPIRAGSYKSKAWDLRGFLIDYESSAFKLWMNRLSWSQWTPDELSNGAAWLAISPYIEARLKNKAARTAYVRSLKDTPQDVHEFSSFCTDISLIKAKNYLEIGSRSGASLYLASRHLPKGSKIISVDLPNSKWGSDSSLPKLENTVRKLKEEGYDAHLVVGNSQEAQTQAKVAAILAGDKVEAALIDGDHTLNGVTKDWEAYSGLLKTGAVVAFHDIFRYPAVPSLQVYKLWEKLSRKYPSVEYSGPGKTSGKFGIGVLYYSRGDKS